MQLFLQYRRAAVLRALVAAAAMSVAIGCFAGEAETVAPDAGAKSSAESATYQTMCVRTCDGYYFPVRQNALPQNFAGDEKTCSGACGAGARLFYFPAGNKPADMIDLSGRKYANEPNAFLFRKTIVPACSCKPAPWSKEAAAQRQHYLDAAQFQAARGTAEAARRTSEEISAAAAREYFSTDAR